MPKLNSPVTISFTIWLLKDKSAIAVLSWHYMLIALTKIERGILSIWTFWVIFQMLKIGNNTSLPKPHYKLLQFLQPWKPRKFAKSIHWSKFCKMMLCCVFSWEHLSHLLPFISCFMIFWQQLKIQHIVSAFRLILKKSALHAHFSYLSIPKIKICMAAIKK